MEIMDTIRAAIDADPRPQREIAALAKIHTVNLSQFKNGQRELPLDTLCTLADVLGLEITIRHPKKRR